MIYIERINNDLVIAKSNIENMIDITNISLSDISNSENSNFDIIIDFDGYICPRITFTSQTGYCTFYIKNENKITIFAQQINCGVNYEYSYDGCYVPVKKGWYLYFEGTGVQSYRYYFSY